MSLGTREGPRGRLLVCTSDLDDLVTRATAIMSRHTVAPARPGGFTAQVFGVHIPGRSLLETDYGMPLRLTAEPLPDYVAVALPLTGSMTATHHGRRFDARAGRSALVGTPGSELVMDWDEALRLLVLPGRAYRAANDVLARIATRRPHGRSVHAPHGMRSPAARSPTAEAEGRGVVRAMRTMSTCSRTRPVAGTPSGRRSTARHVWVADPAILNPSQQVRDTSRQAG